MSDEVGIARANALYRSGAYREALELYEKIGSPQLRACVQANIALCRKKLGITKNNVTRIAKNPVHQEIVVTLTTIRSRLVHLRKVVESLLCQTLQPTRIELNISHEPYLLDEGIERDNPLLLELLKLPKMRINWVENIGPYRKIWPILERHFCQREAADKIFVTVDDDTVYPDYMLQQLYENYLKYGCVIAFRGRHIEMDGEKIAPYSEWTWGRAQASHSNVPTGKDGALYCTAFFTKDFLNINDALRIAPTADDLWIKWHCSMNGIPAVVLNPEACSSDYKSFPLVSYDKGDRENSLYHAHNSHTSGRKNDVAINDLERYYGASRGCTLARVINNCDVIPISIDKEFPVTGTYSLPRLLFLEQSSKTVNMKSRGSLEWRANSDYEYAVSFGDSLEIGEEISHLQIGAGFVLLAGIAYSPEVAGAVIELMIELKAQNVLRYRLSSAPSDSDVVDYPYIKFWLPEQHGDSLNLDAQMPKNCAHLSSIKRLRQLLEQQQNCSNGWLGMLGREARTYESISQGYSRFKEKFLGNCYVLNLAHRTDRLKRVNEVFKTIGVCVNRVDAVYGEESRICRKLFHDVSTKYEKLVGSGIEPFRWDIDMYQNYLSEKSRNVHYAKKHGKLLSLGSLGYLLSYRKALIQGLCSDGYDYITIFDDDVVLHSDWESIIGNAFWQLPDNPAVIMLGAIQYHWGKGINWYSQNLYCCNGTSIASHATVIHKDFALYLVEEIEKVTLPFDIGALHYLKSRLFGRSFVIYPNVFIQDTSESDIADTKNQRAVGQSKDNVYRWELDKYKVGLV